MKPGQEALLAEVPTFRRLSVEDRRRLAEVAKVRTYSRSDLLFSETDSSETFFTVVKGRVKVFKMTPAGKDIILEIFGPGDPVGAVAVYEDRPYPASAMAMEETTCVEIGKRELFGLLENHPSLVRGLLLALTHRLVELTHRLSELTGGRVEPRFARLFLKLANEKGEPAAEGLFIPIPLSRQELADLTGTAIETTIRIMSRWSREGIVSTEKEGFRILDRQALEVLSYR